MSTCRRLAEQDVKAIFECLEWNKYPPEQLKFTIVPVGSNALKLSPPSIQFEDGLYILLRPCKKSKHNESTVPSRIPSNLCSLVATHLEKESQECPWSLSGPQFPQSTVTQQRYCYPKGDPVYSKNKGGALWTMYKNEKEDLEYRLLHVYFSAKRAINQMERKAKEEKQMLNTCTPSPTRMKRANTKQYSTRLDSSPSYHPPWQNNPSHKISLSPATRVSSNSKALRNNYAYQDRNSPWSYQSSRGYGYSAPHFYYPDSQVLSPQSSTYYTPGRAYPPSFHYNQYEDSHTNFESPYYIDTTISSPISSVRKHLQSPQRSSRYQHGDTNQAYYRTQQMTYHSFPSYEETNYQKAMISNSNGSTCSTSLSPQTKKKILSPKKEEDWMISQDSLEPLPFDFRLGNSWDLESNGDSKYSPSNKLEDAQEYEGGKELMENEIKFVSMKEWGDFEDLPTEAV